MDERTIKFQQISDTIFEDDNAALKLISLFESGKVDFKLATAIDNVIMDANMLRESNGEFLVHFNLLPEWEDKFRMDYFFEKPAILATHGVRILINNTDVTAFKQSIGEGIKQASIKINAFRGDLDDNKWKNSKQSAYYRYDCDEFKAYSCGVFYDMTTSKDQNSSWKNCVKIKIDNRTILFFHVRIEDNFGYFVFKTNDPINHDDFLHIINAIRAAFSLISGFYIADSAYFFSMQKGKKDTLTYRYENFNETIHTKRPLLDNHSYQDISREELHLNSDQFAYLVKLLYENEELLRSCILLTQASNINGLPKGCLAAVALETITNVIVPKDKIAKPLIEDTEISSQLKYELKKALKKIKGKVTKSTYDSLDSKLGKINERSNSSKLGSPFGALSINLDEEDLYCISCRNRFLHGSLPTPPTDFFKSLTDDELLNLVCNRLIMLSTMLILKKIGYEHDVVDWGYTEIAIRRMMIMGESVSGIGRAHRTIGN